MHTGKPFAEPDDIDAHCPQLDGDDKTDLRVKEQTHRDRP
jgi:hypothetical protein